MGPDPRQVRWRRAAALTVVTALVAAVLLQTGEVRRSSSLTPDEEYNLGVAIRSRQAGRLDPILVESGTAPLPILVNFLPWLGRVPPEPRENAWIPLPG